MVWNKLFWKLRMFWSKLYKSNWNCAWNLTFPVFISPIVRNMCENLHYESVYFKELHNEQECYWPTIYRAGAAVVSAVTGFYYYSLWWPLYEEQWKPSQSSSVKVTTKVAMFSVLLILCRSLQNVIIYIKNCVIVERDNCLLGKI